MGDCTKVLGSIFHFELDTKETRDITLDMSYGYLMMTNARYILTFSTRLSYKESIFHTATDKEDVFFQEQIHTLRSCKDLND